MLSVLIPTYNYSAYELVFKIHNQCTNLKINFEIIVREDGGNLFLSENRKINSLENCRYIENENNVGRVRNKNALLKQSKFSLKLLLDSDVMPTSKKFIKNYVNFSKNKEAFACFGGLTYDVIHKDKKKLRYNYGIKRECKTVEERSKSPYKLFLTSNTLLKNCQQKFDDKINQYGFEEIVYAENLKKKNIPVLHINNNVMHKNLESNQIFIDKTKEGLRTLIFLEKNKTIDRGKNKVSKLYHFFSKLYLSELLNYLFQIGQGFILKRLINQGGPLWLFDAYRLLYFNKNY